MGSGASFDANQAVSAGTNRYYCHSCQQIFSVTTSRFSQQCSRCESTFIEEIGSIHPSSSLLGATSLSAEQSRRLANAAFMLRLLESQLRDELLHLQSMYHLSEQPKDMSMTKIMLEKLRCPNLSVDMICSQPSCPVCNEDFEEGGIASQLPCSHFFHDECVRPWLNAKRTCPICRFEMTDVLPTVAELELFSTDELVEKFTKLSENSGEEPSKE